MVKSHFKSLLSFAAFSVMLLILCGCNKVSYLYKAEQPPVITLDSEDGIYTVKIGHELTISPDVQYADGATYTWTADGRVIGNSPVLTVTYDVPQEIYVTFRVETDDGAAEEEILIQVLDKTPPVISLNLPEDGLKVLPNTTYIFTPDFQHADEPGFSVHWERDGKIVSEEPTYTFCESAKGVYPITIRAANADGETTLEFTVEVVESLPYNVYFPSQSYYQPLTDRYTVVGRTLYLTPVLEYVENPEFVWKVDGIIVAGATERTLRFTPDHTGTYTVSVTVKDITATVLVHCYASEADTRRDGGTNACINNVFEYLPAPGQFINDPVITGFTADITTQEAAKAYALRRLNAGQLISLGSFGGYITVGFDHSVRNSGGGYDFAIQGNAFNSASGGSNEPGIVWVMQDTNGNGQPDDEWYELRGSATGSEGTIQNHSVTYYRPAGAGMDVAWTDSEGETGRVRYLGVFHNQDYYYPLWMMSATSYTLTGTRLKPRNSMDPTTGFWANKAFDWGYADNMGSDCLTGGSANGEDQVVGFKIDNAMNPDGSAVVLSHIDFVKVQTGVNAFSGALGEVSTEIMKIYDLNLK